MKILIIRLSSRGDVLLTTGLADYIKQNFENATVDLLTYNINSPMLENTSFDQVLTLRKNTKLPIVRKQLNGLRYDYVVDLQKNLRSMAYSRMVESVKTVSVIKGSLDRRLFVMTGIKTKTLKKHVTRRYAEPICKKLDLETPEYLKPSIKALGELNIEFKTQKPILLLHMTASKYTKMYTRAKELIDLAMNRYNVIEVGYDPAAGSRTFNIAEEQLQAGVLDLTNMTNTSQLVELVNIADIVCSTDSLVMHLGVALDKPTVGIFTSTSPEFGFAHIQPRSTTVGLDNLRCKPCHVHGRESCPRGKYYCSIDLPPEDILTKIDTIQ